MAHNVVELMPTPQPETTGQREVLRIVIVGHVDHGKSTLIGRLLYDTGSITPEKIRALEEVSKKRGKDIELAYLLDALQAERDQGITIDVSQIRFKSPQRDYLIIDAPGHKEFITNMVSGAASADGALLVVDAMEGIREQTRRHGYLLHMLGIAQVTVVINKMDQVDYNEKRFHVLEREITQYLHEIGITPRFVLPISAHVGRNVTTPATEMDWYGGPTLLAALDKMEALPTAEHLPLRVPLQDVYKFDDRRILAGRVESGVLRVGDELMFSPSNKIARVKSIEAWNTSVLPVVAKAGQVVGFTLDEQIFVERGEIASHVTDPPVESNVFRAHLFWLGRQPLTLGKRYRMKLATSRHDVVIEKIDRLIDTDSLQSSQGETVARHGIADVVIRSRSMAALDEYKSLPKLGRFVLLDGYDVVGGGLISTEGYPDQRAATTVRSTNITHVDFGVSTDMRAEQNGHRGGVLWFTGLSGAGKSTLAVELERQLHRRGYHVYVLDGDNVREGLNANLGFSPEDRAENIRRVGEVAGLFASAGLIVITAFISPYRADRDRARQVEGGNFHEIFIKSDLATCERRDTKGLYQRARRGEIKEFTGVSAPYEEPEAPELVVDTSAANEEVCIEQLLTFVANEFRQQ